MENGPKAMLASVLVLVLAAGGEYLYVRHERAAERNAVPVDNSPTTHVDPDNLVVLKQMQPHTFSDIEGLKGRTVWVAAGDQLNFYPVEGKTIQFSKDQGTLFGAEPLNLDGAEQAKLPANVFNRVPRGDRQVFLLFHKPGNPQQFAVPVGSEQAGAYTFMTDNALYYDDPRKLWSDWGPQVWAAIDQHKVIPGMSERQAEMSLGQVITPQGNTVGDRTVDYDNGGHDVLVTFVNNKATKVVGPK